MAKPSRRGTGKARRTFDILKDTLGLTGISTFVVEILPAKERMIVKKL